MRAACFFKTYAASAVLLIVHSASYAFDSAAIEIGYGNKTRLAHVGLQWKWESKWWQSNGSHLSGYWDLTLTQWHGARFQNLTDRDQNLTAIGVTPVFRFQSDTLKGSYVEGGIGAYYLSELYDNNGRRLSTRFQFGDHIGAGYVFRNNLDLGMKIQHFSNGGIKQPNNGVNFAIIRMKYPFSF